MIRSAKTNKSLNWFADVNIAKGVRFGPYPGEDAMTKNDCKWMLQIAEVDDINDANLLPTLQGDNVYFEAFKEIKIGEKLLVWLTPEDNAAIKDSRVKCSTCDKKKTVKNYPGFYRCLTCLTQQAKMFYLCEKCGKTYNSKQTLNQHNNVHLRKYLCEVCGKCCPTKEKLNNHIQTHLKSKFYW